MLSAHFGGGERLFVDVCLALADKGHSILAVCHPDFEGPAQLDHPSITRVALLYHWD